MVNGFDVTKDPSYQVMPKIEVTHRNWDEVPNTRENLEKFFEKNKSNVGNMKPGYVHLTSRPAVTQQKNQSGSSASGPN